MPPRELRHLALDELREFEGVEDLAGGAGVVVEGGPQVQELADAQVLEDLGLLRLNGDAAAELVPCRARVEAQGAHGARVGGAQANRHLQGGALPGAVGAEEGVDLVLLGGEGHAREGVDGPSGCVVALADVPQLKSGALVGHGGCLLERWLMANR